MLHARETPDMAKKSHMHKVLEENLPFLENAFRWTVFGVLLAEVLFVVAWTLPVWLVFMSRGFHIYFWTFVMVGVYPCRWFALLYMFWDVRNPYAINPWSVKTVNPETPQAVRMRTISVVSSHISLTIYDMLAKWTTPVLIFVILTAQAVVGIFIGWSFILWIINVVVGLLAIALGYLGSFVIYTFGIANPRDYVLTREKFYANKITVGG